MVDYTDTVLQVHHILLFIHLLSLYVAWHVRYFSAMRSRGNIKSIIFQKSFDIVPAVLFF